MIGNRLRIEPERPGNVDGGPVKRRCIQVRSLDGRQAGSGALDPYVARAVDHELRHVHVVEDGLQPRQEGGDVVKGYAHGSQFPGVPGSPVRKIPGQVVGFQILSLQVTLR